MIKEYNLKNKIHLVNLIRQEIFTDENDINLYFLVV